MDDELASLRAQCAAGGVSDAERLRAGETRRFSGRPAPAEPGTLALAHSDLTIIVAEAEVRAARDRGGGSSFTVGADANVTFRLERTVRAGDLAMQASPCAPSERSRRLPDGIIDLATGVLIGCSTAVVCFGAGDERVCVEIFYNCRASRA